MRIVIRSGAESSVEELVSIPGVEWCPLKTRAPVKWLLHSDPFLV
jgi:hypothetical protein